MAIKQVPFHGVFSTRDGTYRDMLTGTAVDRSALKHPAIPFYGVFVDSLGVEHDLTELAGGGSVDLSNYYTKTEVLDLLAKNTADDLTPDQVAAIVNVILQQAEGVDLVTPAMLATALADIRSQINSTHTTQDTNITNLQTAVTNLQNSLSDYATKSFVQESLQPLVDAITAQNAAIATVQTNLNAHITGDDARWQSVSKLVSDLRVELKQFVVDTYAGSTPKYDYSQTQTIMMGGGLVNLADQGTYTIPVNGAIQAQVGGLLGAGLSLMINGIVTWVSPLNLLVPLNSPEIQVNAGDQISYSGVIGLGQTFQVDYFPNKGT